MKALEVKELDSYQIKAIMNEIIRNVPAENSIPNLFSHWRLASDDLELEFDEMMNLQ